MMRRWSLRRGEIVLVTCPSCGKRISDRAPRCPFCNAAVREGEMPSGLPVALAQHTLSSPTPLAPTIRLPEPVLEPAASTPAAGVSSGSGSVAPPPAPATASPNVAPLPVLKRGDFIGGNLQVIDVLGEGGFGIVYLVSSQSAKQTSALKTLRSELLRDPAVREMFRKEVQIWIDLGAHPHLVRAHWVDEIQGRLWLAMEYVAPDPATGINSLEGYLGKWTPPVAQAITWGIELCHGMEYAVSRGIRCHRDIKPANILLGADRRVRISDFGIAGVVPDRPVAQAAAPSSLGQTAAGTVFGTPTHMSPEQFLGASRCDERSDVYSFGIVLHQMASGGRLPFLPPPAPPGVDRMAHFFESFRRLHQEASPPRVDSPLQEVVGRCLRKDPADRFQSFAELRHELEALLGASSGRAVAQPERQDPDAAELSNRGLSFAALDRYAEALGCYDEALKLEPRLAPIHNNRGNALRHLGRVDESLAAFDYAIALDPRYAAPHTNKGLTLAAEGRQNEALACFERALTLDVRSVDAWVGKGVVLGQLGRVQEELVCLDRALEVDPRDEAALLNRGITLSRLGRAAEAIASFDRCIESNPAGTKAWLGKGVELSESGRPEEAIACFDEALRLEGSLAQAWYNKGNALAQRQRLDEARACFIETTRLAPSFPTGWYNRGLSEFQLGQLGDAARSMGEYLGRAQPSDPLVAEAKKILEWIRAGHRPQLRASLGERIDADGNPLAPVVERPEGPPGEPVAVGGRTAPPREAAALPETPLPQVDPLSRADEWNTRSKELFEAERYAEALECSARALGLHPGNSAALNNQANCLFRLGRRDEALAVHEKVLEDAPLFLASWLNRAAMLDLMGRKADALCVLQDVIALATPGDPSAALQARQTIANLEAQGFRPAPRGALGWLALGFKAATEGRWDEAFEAMDRAISLDPRRSALWRWKGTAHKEARQFEDALQAFAQAIQADPKSAEAHHSLGQALATLRRFDEALAAYDHATEADPRHAASWSDRGKLLGILKHYDAAVESLAMAAALAPESPAPWQNKALAEDELGREADALASYRRFLERASPDMHLQVEQAKARVAVLQGRLGVRAASTAPVATSPPLVVQSAGGQPDAPRGEQGKPSAPPPPREPLPEARVPDVKPTASPGDCQKRGEICLNQGQHEKALGWFDQAIVLEPGRAYTWEGKGDALRGLRRIGEAAVYYRKAAELNPKGAPIWRKLASTLEILGRHDEALAACDAGLAVAPKDAALWNGRGANLIALGREPEALPALQEALALDPRLAMARFHQAQIEEKLGQRAEATRSYQQFLSLAPPQLGSQIQEARRRLQELRVP
jgi:tetratricopeptide (TPR) repeat protein